MLGLFPAIEGMGEMEKMETEGRGRGVLLGQGCGGMGASRNTLEFSGKDIELIN